MDILKTNIEAYRTDEAIEKYSHYGLYPNEKYLFLKYFSFDKYILDMACGAGRTTLRLTELGYKVKGVDLSAELISVARKRFPNINFEPGDFCDIQEKDSSIDNILISHNGLDYAFPEKQRNIAIAECYRVLRKGGYLITSAHNIKSLHFSPYYFKERKMWYLKNLIYAFKTRKYIHDLKMWTFYCSTSYCKKMFESAGFKLVEIVGFRQSTNKFFIDYISPYNHFVFQKKD